MSVYRPDVPLSVTFLELMGIFEEYAYLVRDMWPSFWLKAAAVHDGKRWNLSYFALVGRWREAAVEEVWEPGNALVVVSKQLSADDGWKLLNDLVAKGVVALSDAIIAEVPNIPVPSYHHYQEPTPQPPLSTTADVAENAEWTWLYVYDSGQWLPSTEHNDLLRRLQPDLERHGLRDYQRLINAHFGVSEYRPNDSSCDRLQYHLDLPLALRIIPGISDPDAHTRPVIVACRPPLTLKQLTLTSGSRPSVTHTKVPILDHRPVDDGWMCGTATISSNDSKIWLASPLLYRTLQHDISVPTPAAQVTDAIAHIYDSRKPARGEQAWAKHLLEGQDDQFELALLNALTRFGIPVLFAGQLRQHEAVVRTEHPSEPTPGSAQVQTKDKPKAHGPATPGFDLMALDTARKRAVLISAKGITHNPGDDDIENLLKATIALGRKLDGWFITGLIACHASSVRLVRLRERKDIVIWGQDELEALLRADTPEPVERMLWMRPGWPQLDIFQGYY